MNGLTLKILRQFRGLTQWELGRRTNISNRRLSMFENNWTRPREREIKKLSQVLNCDEKELIEVILDKKK